MRIKNGIKNYNRTIIEEAKHGFMNKSAPQVDAAATKGKHS